jgi:hypothetical protein
MRRGLDYYGAFTIERSRWIAEQQAINSVHDPSRRRSPP